MDIQINIKKLKSVKSEAVDRLAEFLKGRFDAEIEIGDQAILFKSSEDEMPKRTVKDSVKKFLRKEKLDKKLRVTTSDPITLYINSRKYVT